MDQCFEMRVTDRPIGGRKIILVVGDRQITVQCLLSRVAYLAIYPENILVYLAIGWFSLRSNELNVHTHELSDTDKILGAKAEVGALEVEPP